MTPIVLRPEMRCYTALMAAAALLLLLLVSLAVAADRSIAPYRERSEMETRRMFMKWKAKHGKAYHSVVEEELRYVVFKGKLRLVEQHNAAADTGVYPYRLGLNHTPTAPVRRFIAVSLLLFSVFFLAY